MQWFRSYVGTHSDPKLATVARKVGLHRTMVLAVWLAIEECASASRERGNMSALDFEDVATALDMDAEQVQAIVVAFKDYGVMSAEGVLVGWVEKQDHGFRPPTDEWRLLRARIFERDNYTCGYCGARGVRLECDHIVPVSRGGDHQPSNLITACFKCNRSKRAKLVSEWRRETA